MYSILVLSALASLVLASPCSPVGSVDSAEVQGACAVQPLGYGPVADPDTPYEFLINQAFDDMALAAQTPDKHLLEFQNLKAAAYASNHSGYLGYDVLTSYSVSDCQAYCDQTEGCIAFNIYVERDPMLEPNMTYCANPQSTTNYKCALFANPISLAQAVNSGQWRAKFQVVISGSNAYNKAYATTALTNSTLSSVNTTSSVSATGTASATTATASSYSPELFTGAAGLVSVNYGLIGATLVGALAVLSL